MQVASELTVLRLMQHGSLVSYLFSAHQGSRTSIFMQWAGDSLQDALAGQLPCAAEGVVQHIMAQLTSAVAHLHQQVRARSGSCARAAHSCSRGSST